MGIRKYLTIGIIFPILGVLIVFSNPQLALGAQSAPGWSEPINLSNSETQSNTPSITADPYGNVHVVWSEAFDDGRSFIMYTKFDGTTWSSPQEIVTSPYNQTAVTPVIAADAAGNLHLVWVGDATIYYSQARYDAGSTAQGWSSPSALEYRQNDISSPYLVIDELGILHLIYAITIGENSGIYMMRSTDNGDNWMDPVTVYRNLRSDRAVSVPRIAVGDDGSLHAVWVESEYPNTFPPVGIRYAFSETSNLVSWSEVILVAEGPYSYPDVQTHGREIHVTWSGTSPDRFRFHQWSVDRGRTWSLLDRNSEIGGFQGYSAMVKDSGGGFNWVTPAGVYANQSTAVVYTRWLDNRWWPAESAYTWNESNEQHLSNVAAAISLGDELVVVFARPHQSSLFPEGWQSDIYFLHKSLPIVEYVPLPTPSPEFVRTPTYSSKDTSVALLASTATTAPLFSLEAPRRSQYNSAVTIGIGAMLSLSIVLFAILIFGKGKQG